MAAVAAPLNAQSITAGVLSGIVRNEATVPMRDARVVLRTEGGLERAVETNRNGRFEFAFVESGTYELVVERLGYRPVAIQRIAVRPGREVSLSVQLQPMVPPITGPDVRQYDAGIDGMSRAGAEWVFADHELEVMPDDQRDLAELARYTTVATEELETEGLPGRFTGVVVDGIPQSGVAHPALATMHNRTAPFGFLGVSNAQLLTNGLDVEWGGFASGTLSGYTHRGSREFRVRALGDWSGNALSSSRHFDAADLSHNTLRGGVMLAGPVIRDTAHFAVAVEGRRFETPLPPAWVATPFDDQVLATAAGFGVDLTDYIGARKMETEMVSLFGRFDWQISDRSSVSVRTNVASFATRNPELGPWSIPNLGSEIEAADVSAAAAFKSQLSRSLGIEVRLGFELVKRDYETTEFPATFLTEGPIAFGDDPALPGVFDRLAFHLTPVFHAQAGQHRFKLGAAGTVSSLDYQYDFNRGGAFYFGGLSQFSTATGVFMQSSGSTPSARFSLSQIGFFIQDTWKAAPGVEILGGIRVDMESLPIDEVTPNATLLERTGLANDVFEESTLKVSPRIGITWNVDEAGQWIVETGLGVYHGQMDPATMAELATRSTGDMDRTGIDTFSDWPDIPNGTLAPELGEQVTLLGPDFQAPRSVRGSFGISKALGRATALHLSGVYRHTDYLPRRHDLNLPVFPVANDQFGRPIYGDLVQDGSLLAATPGSNRQFDEFSRITAVNPDGFSDYWGLTARVERRFGSVTMLASYTYSRTEDNWLGGGGASPDLQLSPFPDSLSGADWAEGRSDFDVPHRFLWGLGVEFGRVRLAGFYRFQSGRPFTPGFRDGVDANGDGSSRNDPAFVDGTLPGMTELFASWDCLQDQNGRFVDRNSCRAPGVHTLDFRIAVHPTKKYPVALVLDALNVIDSDVADRDRALYLIDPNGALAVDPGTGDVAVPLVTNPNFGEPTVRRSTGRKVRIGVRVNYE